MWFALNAEDRAADFDLLALDRRVVCLSARADRFADGERVGADLPVAAVAPDADAAASPVLVIAVVQLDNRPPGVAQRRHRLGLADAEEIGLAGRAGHDVRRLPAQLDH